MTGANLLFVVLGGLAALVGAAMLVAALRRGRLAESRASNGLLIAGMMIFAFGLILAGFAIAYTAAEPVGEGA